MFRFGSGPNRERLCFKEEVLSAFNFLTKEHGFHCVKAEITFVRYESQSVFINIYHGRGSFEIGFEIGQLDVSPKYPEVKYTLGDLLDLVGVREKEEYTFFQASTKERIKIWVPKLAELVRKYGGSILKGVPDIFGRLKEIQTRNSEMYLKEIRISRIRKKAEEVWHSKDYKTLVKLYESIREDLTPAEAKKLEYARRRL